MKYERGTCSKLSPVFGRCLIWFLGKILKNSQKIDLNRIIRQPIFQFLKFEFFGSIVVEAKPFVGSFVHVILTQQTCGQRSSRAAESKRRALGYYFFERICYMFHISKCRGDWYLSLCTTSGLAFGEPQRSGKIRFFLRRNTFFPRKSPLRCGSPNASPDVVHRPRSQSPLHFDMWNI